MYIKKSICKTHDFVVYIFTNSIKPKKMFDFLTAVFFSIFSFLYLKVHFPKYYCVSIFDIPCSRPKRLTCITFFYIIVYLIFLILPIKTDNMRNIYTLQYKVRFKPNGVLCTGNIFQKPKIIQNLSRSFAVSIYHSLLE